MRMRSWSHLIVVGTLLASLSSPAWSESVDSTCAIVPSPNVDRSGDWLNAVAAISPRDAWAAGSSGYGSLRTLTAHWNGQRWTAEPSPNVEGATWNQLFAVDMLSADDVWAVGSYMDQSFNVYPLTLHWDGQEWVIVPAPGTGSDWIYGVDVLAPNDAWAVGYHTVDGNPQATTLHWDGVQWSTVPTPSVATRESLYDVEGVAGNDVWAVGYADPIPGQQLTLTLHWDGGVWALVPSKSPGSHAVLKGVSTNSADDVWAAGDAGGATLTEHWDGAEWTVVPSPSDEAASNSLQAIDAWSSNDIWAAGFAQKAKSVLRALHSNGEAWKRVLPPKQGAIQQLLGVAAFSRGDAWFVGIYYPSVESAYRTLIIRCSGGAATSP